jgi:hypothetical protein
MLPLEAFSREVARALRVVAFDIDDTVLTHGKLTLGALGALGELGAAGLVCVGVTGRSCAFATLVTKQWGLDGCVAENGAFYIHIAKTGAPRLVDAESFEVRARNTARLTNLREAMAREVPELELADDNTGRRSDVAWDIAEYANASEHTIGRAIALIAQHGGRSTRSSVHLHATWDTSTKATGLARFCEREVGLREEAFLRATVFIGDSGNDAPCFDALPWTVGVANVRRHADHLPTLPRYVTTAEMGAGFAEFASRVLELRT